MSLQLLLLFICCLNIYCNSESTTTCNDDVCEVSEETIGQKLLRKQTEFYHLTKPTYSEDSGAIGIKFHNPNDEVYDMYWYDPGRRKG